jgi:hypothetical protein
MPFGDIANEVVEPPERRGDGLHASVRTLWVVADGVGAFSTAHEL